MTTNLNPGTAELAGALCGFDTCILADALDQLGFQPRNRGFTHPGLKYFGKAGVTVAGYAATARVRASETPLIGHTYFRHSDWWEELCRLPKPRLVVMEDMDSEPGSGACIGELGAALFRGFNCVGAITNGSARDITKLVEMDFALLAAHLSPARAYAHLIAHSVPVEIFSLKIEPGDFLVADCHGVLSIPPQAHSRIVGTAIELQGRKREFIEFCSSDKFSIQTMEGHLKQFQL